MDLSNVIKTSRLDDFKKQRTGSRFSRRDFIGISATGIMGAVTFDALGNEPESNLLFMPDFIPATSDNTEDLNLLGPYGKWASENMKKGLPTHSFRRKEWKNIEKWRKAAKKIVLETIASPDLGKMTEVKVNRQYIFDELQIEEITWQLPYGMPTEAFVLKPANAKAPLPGILAFHHHGADKYSGTRKILITNDLPHPHNVESQKQYYDGYAWANELAKRGYVVMVHDAYPFGSRRLLFKEVPELLRGELTDDKPEELENIIKYNRWA